MRTKLNYFSLVFLLFAGLFYFSSAYAQGPGYAIAFDGVDDKVQTSDPILTGTGDFTISAWIKRSSTGTVDFIAGNYGLGNTNGIEFGVLNTDKIFVYIAGTEIFGTTTLVANTWYHVAVTRSSGTTKLYVNGSEEANGTLSGSITGALNFAIGNGPDYTSEAFGGSIDEVRVYNTALTQNDLRLGEHLRLATPFPAGLVAYWRFDQGSGVNAYESVVGGTFNGVLTNGPTWVTSTAPFGDGTSSMQTVSSTGVVSFSSQNVSFNFTAKSGSDDFVVTRINTTSSGTSTGATTVVPNMYWIIEKYGANTFTADITFSLADGAVSPTDQATPSNIKIFSRTSNSDGAWTTNSASGTTFNTVTYSGVSSLSQFVIGTNSTSPLTGPPSISVTSPALPYDFGSSVIPVSTTHTFTITNSGTGWAHITGVTFSNSTNFSTTTSLPIDIAPGGTAPLIVQFATSLSGSFSTGISVAYNAASSPYTVADPGFATGVGKLATPTGLSPDGVTAVLLTPTLTFNPVSGSGTVTYTVQLSPQASFADPGQYQLYDINTSTSHTVPAGRLLYNTLYYWRVKATDAGGSSGASDYATASFRTKLATPTTPSPDSGAVAQPISLTLGWSAISGADKYHLQVNTASNFTGTDVFNSYDVSTNSQLISGLSKGTNYYWRVRARETSPADSSDFSNTFTFSTLIDQTPTPSWPIGGATVYTLSQQLSWYMNDNTGGPFTFDVQYTTDNTFTSGLTTVTGISGTSLTSALANGNLHYYWRVRAKNAAGFYSVWANADFVTDASLNGAPVPVLSWPIGGATIYTTSPTLNWYLSSSVSGTVTYDLQYGTDNTFTTTTTVSGLSSTNYTIAGPLTAGSTYYWRVRSHNDGNTSAYSTAESFVIDNSQGGAPVPVPSWPIGGATVYSNPPTLNWYLSTAATGTITYDIQYGTDSTNIGALTTESGISSTSKTLGSTLTGGATYFWRVRSHNGSNTSAYSAFESFVVNGTSTVAPVPIPSWPIGGATVYTTTPTLSWYLGTGVSGTVTYDVQLSSDSTFTDPAQQQLYNTNQSSTNATVPSGRLVAGTTYYWRVLSHLGASTSAYSAFTSFVVDAGSSGAPTPVPSWPVGGATVYSTTPTLSWYINSGASGTVTYEVEIRTAATSFSGATNTGISGTSFTLGSPLVTGTNYHWRVRLHSSTAGYSSWSSEATFTTYTPSGSVAAPTLGEPDMGITIASSSASLSWYLTTAPAANQSYRVELSRNADMTSPFMQIDNISSFNKVVSSLGSGTYYWRVQAVTSDGKYSGYSKTGAFVISGVTAVDNETNVIPKTYEVSQNYPNPFNPSTVIKYGLPEASFVTIKIYNMLGQEVKTLVAGDKEAGSYRIQWNGDDNYGNKVSSGAYIYRIVAGSFVQARKMVLLK